MTQEALNHNIALKGSRISIELSNPLRLSTHSTPEIVD
jgi:hypothetical protein